MIGFASLPDAFKTLLNQLRDDPIKLGDRIAAIEQAGHLTRLKLATPAASNDALFKAAVTLASGATTVLSATDLLTNTPDVCRNVIVTVALAGGSLSGNVTLVGTDFEGRSITEDIAVSTATVYQSLRAYKTLTGVTLPQRTTSGDTIKVGTGSKLGLSQVLLRATLLHAVFNKVRETTFPTVVVDATDISKNLVLLNSALNGSEVCLYFINERD